MSTLTAWVAIFLGHNGVYQSPQRGSRGLKLPFMSRAMGPNHPSPQVIVGLT